MNITVGGSCVQALSSEMTVQVKQNGKVYQIDFEKGYVTNKTREVDTCDENEHGTTVSFIMDEEIWKDSDDLNVKALEKRIKQNAYLNPGLTLYFMQLDKDDNVLYEKSYCFPEGLKTYVAELTANKKRLTDIIRINTSLDEIDIQIGMTYVDNYNEDIYTFCNNMNTIENGDHLTGFLSGLNSAIKKYIDMYNVKLDYKQNDIKEGLTAIVSVKVPDPIFEGQAKTKLRMASVRNAVKEITEESILDYLDKNPDIAKLIIAKIQQAAKARIAAAKAREGARKSKNLNSDSNPEKLADCTSKNPEECEIYIVEGDSAGGSAKQGRDRKFQAILPVFGKILNVEKARLDKVLASEKMRMIIQALHCGIGEDFDINKLRYHKIILFSDADVDGYHIACLHITFIWRFMREIIEKGYLYISCPPKYKIVIDKDTTEYAFDEQARDEILKKYNNKYSNITYLKGLGEMNPEQLWDTSMNPETRTLIRVTSNMAEDCEKAISLCMSEDSIARKNWLLNINEDDENINDEDINDNYIEEGDEV